jgi:hypothetical protein
MGEETGREIEEGGILGRTIGRLGRRKGSRKNKRKIGKNKALE